MGLAQCIGEVIPHQVFESAHSAVLWIMLGTWLVVILIFDDSHVLHNNISPQSFECWIDNKNLMRGPFLCWIHTGAMSALADRIKIARGGMGDDINLSIQYILNCGGGVAGSCWGGSSSGVRISCLYWCISCIISWHYMLILLSPFFVVQIFLFEWYHLCIPRKAYEFAKTQGFIPYDTCMPYLACSADSDEGFCKHVDTSCIKSNICRTCSTFASFGGTCSEVNDALHSNIYFSSRSRNVTDLSIHILSPCSRFNNIFFFERLISSPMQLLQSMVLTTFCRSTACTRLKLRSIREVPSRWGNALRSYPNIYSVHSRQNERIWNLVVYSLLRLVVYIRLV